MELKNEHFVNSLCFGVLLTGLTTMIFTDTAYAGQWISEGPNEWYYIKENGEYANNEILLDDKGNVYSFDEEGMMIADMENNGLSWGSSGAWVNKMARNEDVNESKFQEYKKNGIVYFSSRNEYIDFLNYVSTNYVLKTVTTVCTIYGSDKYAFDSSVNEKFDEVLDLYNQYFDYMNNIVNESRASTDEETIRNIGNYIMDIATYDKNQEGVISMITEGKAICSTYTRFFNILCGLAGYNCEEVYCYILPGGGYHAINRVWYGDRWH